MLVRNLARPLYRLVGWSSGAVIRRKVLALMTAATAPTRLIKMLGNFAMDLTDTFKNRVGNVYSGGSASHRPNVVCRRFERAWVQRGQACSDTRSLRTDSKGTVSTWERLCTGKCHSKQISRQADADECVMRHVNV